MEIEVGKKGDRNLWQARATEHATLGLNLLEWSYQDLADACGYSKGAMTEIFRRKAVPAGVYDLILSKLVEQGHDLTAVLSAKTSADGAEPIKKRRVARSGRH